MICITTSNLVTTKRGGYTEKEGEIGRLLLSDHPLAMEPPLQPSTSSTVCHSRSFLVVFSPFPPSEIDLTQLQNTDLSLFLFG